VDLEGAAAIWCLAFPRGFCAAEEMIWSKSFVMEPRALFDGADGSTSCDHVGRGLDWTHLLNRYGEHAGVLLGAPGVVPVRSTPDSPCSDSRDGCSTHLWSRRLVLPPDGDRVCRGTLLSRAQYLVDVHAWATRMAAFRRTAG
jgi:hypothetical protein